uniref:Phosphodiesterase n=1 Tax=Albugo laibachii Nc14 TaxID=890382 RepID=F0W9R7_9STRA|nr:cAMPspecific 3' putative [Albugo laibachii Nc14]|eukprot:CCA17885.1 cAMPspecific 3' putative [Albugo laibachii Nc14]
MSSKQRVGYQENADNRSGNKRSENNSIFRKKYQSAPELLLWKAPHRNAHLTSLPNSWEDVCDATVAISEGSSDSDSLLEDISSWRVSPEEQAKTRFDSECMERLFNELEIRIENVDEVVETLNAQFGTFELDMISLETHLGDKLMLFIGGLIFEELGYCEDLVDRCMVLNALEIINSRYLSENPFHNACHAADVMHGLYVLLSTTQLRDKTSRHNQFAVLLAAVMHDIEHVGLTNDFLTKSKHRIALENPGKAPMEEMHAVVADHLLQDPQMNLLSRLDETQRTQVLDVVERTILSTALCVQGTLLQDVKHLCETWQAKGDVTDNSLLPFEEQLVLLRLAMHVSDIGQTTKPFTVHEKWVYRLNEEHFLQGDMDKRLHLLVTPSSCDRSQWNTKQFLESQIVFLEGFAIPAIETMNQIPFMDVNYLAQSLQRNIGQWKKQFEECALIQHGC